MDLDLLDLDMFQRGEQDEVFARLRREAPVSWQEHPHGRGFWSVVQHGDVVTVNRDAALFSSEVGSISLLDPDERANAVGADTRGAMMIATDPPRHTRYRRLVNSGFTPRTMKAIEQSLAARATKIIDLVIEQGSCDFVTDVAAELPLQAIADIMGVPQQDRGRLFDWSNRMVGLDDPEYASTDGTVASTELYAYVNDLARQRRADPRDDIVTVVGQRRDRGGLALRGRIRHVHVAAHAGGERDDAQLHVVGHVGPDREPRAVRPSPGPTRPHRLGRRGDSPLGLAGAALSPHGHGRHGTARPADRQGRQGRHVAHFGQPRRESVRRAVPVRHHPHPEQPRGLRRRRSAPLPGRVPGPHAASPDDRGDRGPHPGHATGGGSPSFSDRTSCVA